MSTNAITIIPPHYPFHTETGIKYGPTVKHVLGCFQCPYFAECRDLVNNHNGLAICEAVISAELLPPAVAQLLSARMEEQ